MRKISTIVVGLSLLASSALYADNNDHTGNHMHEGKMANHANTNGMPDSNMETMNHQSMNSGDKKNSNMSAFHKEMMTEGYHVTLSSSKPLSDGKNHMSIILKKDGHTIKNADVKIKFSMPIMPGMEFTEHAKINGEAYTSMVDFSMQGEWAYELDFKTNDGKNHKANGSVNF